MNSTTIKMYHIKRKYSPFRVQGVCRPVDEVVPRCPCKTCRWHGTRQHQESALLPPSSRSGNMDSKSSLGRNEGRHRTEFGFQYLKSSYKYRPHDLLTHS